MPTKLPRILVIDNESHLRKALKTLLSQCNYSPILTATGCEGISVAREIHPDLVILDLKLPDMNGFETCERLRSDFDIPILILSGSDEVKDKIAALDLGADDFMIKPFSPGELLARIRALLRRPKILETLVACTEYSELKIDHAQRQVFVGGKRVKLTHTEFDIFSLLSRFPNKVFTSEMILGRIWGPEYASDYHTLQSHISNLRKKIEPAQTQPRYILSERGVGYWFNAP